MLPFSELSFYILIVPLVGLFWLLRPVISYWLKLTFHLTFAVVFYTVFFKDYQLLFAYTVLSYLVYYLLEYILRTEHKIIGIIIFIFPLLLIKTHTKFGTNYAQDLIAFAGISYYLFKVIHVYVDNNNKEKPVPFSEYCCYLLLPTTLLIGPINRFKPFQNDLKNSNENYNFELFKIGVEKILLGAVYKYVFAEIINRYWLFNFDATSNEIWQMSNVMYSYYLYLFFDFAGYSFLAVGFSNLLGFKIPDNFNLPFLAVNPADYWRRWHITLSEWLKDYFFTPFYKFLSGKKSLKPYPITRQNVALFLTFVIMGYWNGFTNHFVASGVLFGLYSVIHNTYTIECRKKKRDIVFGNLSATAIKYISIFIMFNITAFAVYVFSGKFPFITN